MNRRDDRAARPPEPVTRPRPGYQTWERPLTPGTKRALKLRQVDMFPREDVDEKGRRRE